MSPSPRTGPSVQWITGDDVQAAPGILKLQGSIDSTLLAQYCADAASDASYVLYLRTGKQFTGIAGPITVRPVRRPLLGGDGMTFAWFNYAYGGGGGLLGGSGGQPAELHRYSSPYAPTVTLTNTPVIEIIQVLIDGVLIPSDEYEVRNFKDLVRLRVNASTPPTERWGWPTSQVGDLPDTQPGTFSVTHTYGYLPDGMGLRAAVALAEALVLARCGKESRLPDRVTQVTRQGVTYQLASVIDLLNNKMTGITEVDLFITTVNPSRIKRQPVIWTPNRPPNQRQAVADS